MNSNPIDDKIKEIIAELTLHDLGAERHERLLRDLVDIAQREVQVKNDVY